MNARRILAGIISAAAAILIVAPVGLWSAMALWFRLPAPDAVRTRRGRHCGAIAAVATMIAALHALPLARAHAPSRSPSPASSSGGARSRRPPTATGRPTSPGRRPAPLNGDILTLSDVRDFDWRTDDDFTERWETRSYDLAKLDSLDLILSYWAGPKIAHLIMSFGFSDGQELAWSIEVRREKTGVYSPRRRRVQDAYARLSRHHRARLGPPARQRPRRGRRASIGCAPRPRRSERCLLGYVDEAERAEAPARLVQFDHHQLLDRRLRNDPQARRDAAARLAADRSTAFCRATSTTTAR